MPISDSKSGRRYVFYGLLLLLICAVIKLVEIETSMPMFFQGHSSDAGLMLVENLQSNQFSRRYIVALNETSEGASQLSVLTQQLINQLEQRDDVVQVWPSNQPPIDFKQVFEDYAQHASQIYSLNPEQEATVLFDADGFPQRAAKLKQALLSPQAYLVKPVAIHDPLLLTFNAFKHWRDQFQPQSDVQSRVTHLMLQSRPQAFDFEAQQQLQVAINAVFTQLNQQHGNRFEYKMTGVPVFAVAAQKEIKADVQKVTMLSSVSVVVAFLLLLRSFKALHWTALILISAMAVGALLTTLVFGSTHALTIALGATLIGVCIDYPIHTMVHSAASTPPNAWAAVRRIWPSLLLGGLTTMIGYLALAFTGYPGFQQIAVFALSGIASALLLTRYILPALLENTVLRYPNLPGLKRWLNYCVRSRTRLRIVIALLVVVAISSYPRLQWLDDLEKLSGSSMQQLKQVDQSIRAQLSTIEAGRVVLIEADTLESALQKTEQATLILQQLQRNGSVEDFYPLYPWLVSQQLQQRNLDVYQQQITPLYQQRWQIALAAQGLSVSKLGNLTVEDATLLDAEQILQSQVKQIIAAQVIQKNDQTALVIWLGPHTPSIVADAMQTVEGARYISQRDTINTMAQRYRTTAVKALSYGLLTIFILLVLRYRNLRTAFNTLLPALCAIIFIFGLWSILKQPISFLHLIGSLLAVAICVDYGIFYSENRSGNPLLTYQAMGASMLTTLAAFASLSISTNPLLQTLSVAVTLGVGIGFLLCPVLIQTGEQSHQLQNPVRN